MPFGEIQEQRPMLRILMEINALKLAFYNSLKVFPSKLQFSKEYKIDPRFMIPINENGDIFLAAPPRPGQQ